VWNTAREAIAREIVNRIDTVTLCTLEEVRQIYAKAQRGEFDDIFLDEGGLWNEDGPGGGTGESFGGSGAGESAHA
jgi:hypothetical protein